MSFIETIKSKNTLGAMLLVTGCCIGAGMIGLPVLSALAGFMPASIAMLLCYLFTTITGLLLLEATLWFDHKVNLLTITEFALGRAGKILTWILFLFLFYCLSVAYLDGGGQIFAEILTALFRHPVSREVGVITCALLVGAVTLAGTKMVDGINRYLFMGLLITFCALIFLGIPNIQSTHLARIDWPAAVATVPILLICFGYQNLVPSLTYYLNKNTNAIRFAIIIGNLIPFFIYFLWNFVILGMLPITQIGSKEQVDTVAQLLQGGAGSASVLFYIKAFSLLAILTSFLPNAISFVDFLKDGFKKSSIVETTKTKFEAVLCGLVFIPPVLCTLVYPHLFLQALSFAGGFIDVLLFGVLPATVVLIGRTVKKVAGPYQVLGGVLTPVSIIILSLIVLFLKIQ